MMTLHSFFISSIFGLNSKILCSISFGGSFKALSVLTCKMRYSDLFRRIGFLLSCMSVTMAPEKLITLTLFFWNCRPGCKPEIIESLVIHIVPFGYGQSLPLLDATLSFMSFSLIQTGEKMDSSLSYVFFFAE